MIEKTPAQVYAAGVVYVHATATHALAAEVVRAVVDRNIVEMLNEPESVDSKRAIDDRLSDVVAQVEDMIREFTSELERELLSYINNSVINTRVTNIHFKDNTLYDIDVDVTIVPNHV